MKILACAGLIYLLCLNIAGFSAMARDKKKARHGQWRTPEKNFFIIALLGGSAGVWLGMQHYRHKTQHTTFTIGIPLICLMQLALIIYAGLQLGR